MKDVLADFMIPAVPPSKNDQRRTHWNKRHAALGEWQWLVRAYAPPFKCPVGFPVEVELTFYTQRPRDPGNNHELLLDAMRGLLLEDDDREIVRWLHLASRPKRASPTGQPCTHVVIWRA